MSDSKLGFAARLRRLNAQQACRLAVSASPAPTAVTASSSTAGSATCRPGYIGRATRLALGCYPRAHLLREDGTMRAIGYVRASTASSKRVGPRADAQTRDDRDSLYPARLDLSGSRRTSPPADGGTGAGLARVLAAIESGEADVWWSRLDRLGRSVAHVASILERFPGGRRRARCRHDAGFTGWHFREPRRRRSGRARTRARAARGRATRSKQHEQAAPVSAVHRQMSTRGGRADPRAASLGMRVAHIAEQLNREDMPTPTGRGTWHPPASPGRSASPTPPSGGCRSRRPYERRVREPNTSQAGRRAVGRVPLTFASTGP